MGTGQIKRDIEHSLNLIITGKESEIAEGWAKLRKLEDNQVYGQVNTCADILKHILKERIMNVHEIPSIIAWFFKHVIRNASDVSTFVSDLTTFLNNTRIKDMTDLAKILQVLIDYDSDSGNYAELCEAIVTSLAGISTPDKPLKDEKFNDNAIKVESYLKKICSNTKNLYSEGLTFVCLKTLYKIISDKKEQEPSLALATVLQLKEPSFIPDAVNWILLKSQCDDELVQALKILCTWFPKWRGDRLGRWIMEFILGLEKKQKDAILIEVTEATLDQMFLALVEPVLRRNASEIIFHILKRQGSPRLLDIIVIMDIILLQLAEENSESSRECIQEMINVRTAFMSRFNNHLKAYVFPQMNLQVIPQANVVREILTGPTWTNEKEFNSLIEPPRSITGKVGLSNLGNTCYMNSVLQALVMTREFCHEVLNYKPLNDNGEQIILKKLQNLFALLLYSNRISLAPTELWQACRPASFLPGQQQDSSEFLCHLLDMLHEQEKCSGNDITGCQYKIERQDAESPSMEEAGVIKRWTTEENLTGSTNLQRKAQSLADFTQGEELSQTQQLSDSHSDSTDSGIQSVGGEEINMLQTSLVHRVLGGESKITYQCAQCDTSSHNTDKFRDLQLCFPEEIQEIQEVSVQDLINYYLTPEKLTGENKYRCDKCMRLCDAQRIIKILQAPAHLILTLKHFRYDFESRLRTKLRHKVVYNDTIQLPVSTQPNSITETYQLYAAVVHSGYSMDYGHYFTYACDSKQNWYKFNDSYVSHTSFEDFKNLKPPDTPYILFYEKFGSSSGIYEDKPDITTLSKHIQEIVAKDRAAYIEESKHQAEKKSQQTRYQPTFLRRSDNSDDENPPPSNCRGAVNIPTNPFLC